MNFSSGYSDTIEAVTFADDGGVLVGGTVGSAAGANDITFKSGG